LENTSEMGIDGRALYGGILNLDPKDPGMPCRDRLVLSKGHCGPALYAALAWRGYFGKELLSTLNQNGTSLPSHCAGRPCEFIMKARRS
jgi:transketolase